MDRIVAYLKAHTTRSEVARDATERVVEAVRHGFVPTKKPASGSKGRYRA